MQMYMSHKINLVSIMLPNNYCHLSNGGQLFIAQMNSAVVRAHFSVIVESWKKLVLAGDSYSHHSNSRDRYSVVKMSLSVILFVAILTILILYIEIRKWSIKRKLGSFESPSQMPILGVAGRFIGKSNDQIIDIIMNLIKEAKSTPVQAWFGTILAIGICEPEDVQVILSSDDCLNRPYVYDHFHYKLSIIATDREIWKPHRRSLNSTFNVKVLQSFVLQLNEKSRILIKKLKPFFKEPGNLHRAVFICMMDMIARTTMGSELNLQLDEQKGELLHKSVKIIMNSIQYRVVRVWLRWDFMYNLLKVGRDEKIPLEIGRQIIEEMYDKKMNELKLLKSQGIDYLEKVKEENTANYLEKCIILEQNGIFDHDTVCCGSIEYDNARRF